MLISLLALTIMGCLLWNSEWRSPLAERGAAIRAARELSRKGTTRVDVAREPESEPEPERVPTLLSDREDMGLLKLDQDMVRNYVIVAYASRFQEPAEEDWKSIIAILISEGVPTSARTIRQIFKNCQAGNTSAKQKSGAGRKRKLEPGNVGRAAVQNSPPRFVTKLTELRKEKTTSLFAEIP
jgi:hypothetical protein